MLAEWPTHRVGLQRLLCKITCGSIPARRVGTWAIGKVICFAVVSVDLIGSVQSIVAFNPLLRGEVVLLPVEVLI